MHSTPTPTANSVNWTTPAAKLNEYQRRALVTRKRRLAADKRLAAEFTERRRLLQEKLDAIVAAKVQP